MIAVLNFTAYEKSDNMCKLTMKGFIETVPEVKPYYELSH